MHGNRQFGWMMAGLGLLASIGGGMLIGEQASAEMDPFYANVAARMPAEREPVVIADAGQSSQWVEPPDFYNAQAQQQDAAATP